MPISNQSDRSAYAYVIGLSLLVFVIDALTPLGFAEWVFYVIPVALCVLQRHTQLPVIVATALMPLMLLGYVLSPHGADPVIAVFNRGCALVVVWGVAYLARRVILERTQARHLMWLEQGRGEVARNMLGEPGVEEVAENILHALARYMGARVAVLYRIEGDMLVQTASFAHDGTTSMDRFPVGTGMAGEVARDGNPVVLADLPADYLRIGSATGSTKPANILIAPVMTEGHVSGVMEFGFMGTGSFDDEIKLLKIVAEKIGSAIRSAQYRQNLKDLIEETQRQSEELQAQQEELRVTNEELSEHTKALQEAQANLETQHSELEQVNVLLEERNELLEQQKQNLSLAQQALEKKARELERANQYKSEFLANMSHELRTPLNSSLILSHMLAENKQSTLTEEQVRHARTIHAANTDLLNLINDILDLSKIEAGQLTVKPEPVRVELLLDALRHVFEPVATKKKIAFTMTASGDIPAEIVTDELRVAQVLKNLLSNAFKFTESGEVALEAGMTAAGDLRFSVRDTGIGIAKEKQEIIFEAFQQANGSVSRTYGGTGLGLSISRELARLLGGIIEVQSTPGVGSTFTLTIPVRLTANSAAEQEQPQFQARQTAIAAIRKASIPEPIAILSEGSENTERAEPSIKDDKASRKHDRLILIVEDDMHFASVLCDLMHELRFDCVHAASAGAALRLAQQYRPDAILLDLRLPDYSGLSVLERIKRDAATRHIPVHVISVDDHRQTALELGAAGYTLKPAARDDIMRSIQTIEERLERQVGRVLIVEDNASLRESMATMLGSANVEIVSVGTAAEALQHLKETTFDCMVTDINLPDASGFDILDELARGGTYGFPPVIVYTGRMLSRDEEQRLRRYSQSIIIKGAKSPERLLDEVSLFLHRVEESLPAEHQQMLLRARQRDATFEGRRILVAEDDVRNIYALTSIFEPLGAVIEISRNGKEALERLESLKGNVDLILMDVMMPEMDGLTAMKEIRKQPAWKNIPVIALTAKAMANDRKECLDAGASDYIAKPIDVDQLVSLCRVWMPRQTVRA